MTDIDSVLAAHSSFAGLSNAQLERLAAFTTEVTMDADLLFHQVGDEAREFYLLQKGKVALEVRTAGRGSIIIETLASGDLMGISWMTAPYTWSFDARTMESTEAIAFDAVAVRGLCDEDPSIGYEIYKGFALVARHRLMATRLQVLDVYGAR